MIYREHGFVPVRIPPRRKAPEGFEATGWPHRALSGQQTFSADDNIGLLTGVDGIVDVDLDCPEALAVVDRFLPFTPAQFGKISTPNAHRLYRCRGDALISLEFKDPLPSSSGGNVANRGHERMILELRGRTKDGGIGLQTMAPGSVHPNGELVAWYHCEPGIVPEPAEIDEQELEWSVRKVAAAALLIRYWPGEGSRHHASLAVSGALGRAAL
jgi:hypothetical protein